MKRNVKLLGLLGVAALAGGAALYLQRRTSRAPVYVPARRALPDFTLDVEPARPVPEPFPVPAPADIPEQILAPPAPAPAPAPTPTPSASPVSRSIDRGLFLSRIKDPVLRGSVGAGQAQGFNYLMDGWDASYRDKPLPWLAYILATTLWESGRTMQPVHEDGSASYFFKMYDPMGSNPKRAAGLGNTSPGDGVRFHGRGYVQITGRDNYWRMGNLFRADLVNNPDRALEPEIARKILFVGMTNGLFRKNKLSDYFSDLRQDWSGAREIVNGAQIDKATGRPVADLIGDNARKIYEALKSSRRPGLV